MTNEMEIVETGVIDPDFALEIARGNIKGFSSTHISGIVAVQATPTVILSYQVPAWKTAYIPYGKMSTGQGKEVYMEFQYSSNGIDWVTAHEFYCYQVNYDYRFTIPIKLPENYYIRVQGTDGAGGANTSAAFDVILIDNSIE